MRHVVLILTFVLIATHRLPAPISEVQTTPTPKPKRESAPKSTPKPAEQQRIVVRASQFVRPVNVALGGWSNSNFGADVLLNAPPYFPRQNAAEWEFKAERGGRYILKVEYAAKGPRPVRIILNGRLAIDNALNAATGCWEQTCQRLLEQGAVSLNGGQNIMRVERDSVFPHIRQFVFEPTER